LGISFLCVLSVFSSSIVAQSPSQTLRLPSGRAFNHDLVKQGLDSLYNLDFTSALNAFRQMTQEAPKDPTGYFALALVHWWRLETRLGEFTEEEEEQFTRSVANAIEISQKAARQDSRNAQAYLCLGGAYGLRGRWHAAKHNWLRALFDGRRARRDQARALEIDPGLEDAYLGVGLFDYYVAALPKIVQALSFLGSGDKTRGLEELKRAGSQGLFSRTAAQLILIGIYTNTEKTPLAALKIAQELRGEYPNSPFMHELEILILFENRKGSEMQTLAQDFVARSRSRSGFYSPRDLTRGYDHLGAAESLLGQWDKAVVAYAQAIDTARPTDPYLTAAHLHRGEAYDVLGLRAQPMADYRQALRGPKLWESREDAKRYLRNPYRRTTVMPDMIPSLDNQP
jgi:tetratricopeptide (TPR) repeat protein